MRARLERVYLIFWRVFEKNPCSSLPFHSFEWSMDFIMPVFINSLRLCYPELRIYILRCSYVWDPKIDMNNKICLLRTAKRHGLHDFHGVRVSTKTARVCAIVPWFTLFSLFLCGTFLPHFWLWPWLLDIMSILHLIFFFFHLNICF